MLVTHHVSAELCSLLHHVEGARIIRFSHISSVLLRSPDWIVVLVGYTRRPRSDSLSCQLRSSPSHVFRPSSSLTALREIRNVRTAL